MNKKEITKEENKKVEFTPEQVLADFISRNQSENRKTRRLVKKLTGVKIFGTNKPYVK